MILNKEQFDAFSMEIATFGNIPISSQYCGIGCVFCKVHTDSYLEHYPKIPQIDEEDLLKGFEFVNPKVNYVLFCFNKVFVISTSIAISKYWHGEDYIGIVS